MMLIVHSCFYPWGFISTVIGIRTLAFSKVGECPNVILLHFTRYERANMIGKYEYAHVFLMIGVFNKVKGGYERHG